MEQQTIFKEQLDTLKQKIADAQKRDAAKDLAFRQFILNINARLNKNDRNDADLAAVQQMIQTADGIGLDGLADFGVVPEQAPPATTATDTVPAVTESGGVAADGQGVVTPASE